ncbi:DUF6907 domain-containing protein [Streptomyces murinus]|uniref:DUF6907 domain-containing protein n=1 Tax=Streptomyces murinus TaxID=33900 RepID=UPI0037A1B640
MSAEQPRMVMLPTSDHGDVILPEPSWCAGHAHHDPESLRADLIHAGPTVECAFLGVPLFCAEIVQSPFAAVDRSLLGGQVAGVSVDPLGKTLDPVQLYSLAAVFDGYADRLRDLADRLARVLGGEGR